MATEPTFTGRVTRALDDLKHAQKSNRGAPAYSRWVNRPMGRFIAAVGFSLRLTPNQLTAISAALSLTGLVALAVLPATPAVGLLVTVSLVLGFAFDAGDGQLARLRGGGTPAGEWLDHVVDCAKCTLVHLAVLVCWYRSFDLAHPGLLVLPLLYCVQSSVWFFAIILTEQLRRAHAAPATSQPTTGRAPRLRSLLVTPADYGVLCLCFLLLGWPGLFIGAYALLLAVNLCFPALSLRRWYRELSQLGSPTRQQSLADAQAP